jgi:hypothetical protein
VAYSFPFVLQLFGHSSTVFISKQSGVKEQRCMKLQVYMQLADRSAVHSTSVIHTSNSPEGFLCVGN